jgi:hypothetical protein
MSIKNKYVSKNVLGKVVNYYKVDRTSFYELDNILTSITIPIDDINNQLQSIVSRLTTSFSETAIENSLETLSLSQADDKLIELFAITEVTDPLMMISGRYFVEDNATLQIIKNDSRSHLFSFYSINKTNNNFVVDLSDSKFQSFILEFLPKTNELVPVLGSSYYTLLKIIFCYSLFKYIRINNVSSYTCYEKSFHQEKSNSVISSYYEIDPQYNFYLKNYEDTFKQDFSYESMIPNFYSVNSFLLNENTNTKPQLSLGENIAVTKQTVASQEYFNKFAETVKKNLNNLDFLNFYSSITKNILVDTQTIGLKEITTENFPYVNQIKFSISNNNVASYLIDSELENLTLNNVYSGFNTLAQVTEAFSVETKTEEKVNNLNGQFIDVNGNKYDKNIINSISSQELSKVGYDYVYSFSTSGFDVKQNQAFKFISDLITLQNPKNVFKFIKLNKFFNDLYASYKDYKNVENLELLRSDSLCYFVEKVVNNNVIQTIGISPEKSQELLYKDTQVIYNKNVTYNIYSADITPTINLNYQNLNLINSTKLSFDLDVRLIPQVYKNLISSKNVVIADKPPVTPNVRFITYKNINNTVTMLFNTTQGIINDYPIQIQNSDLEIFNSIQQIQKSVDGKLTFESDSPLSKIQVFSTNTLPTKYSDFSNSLLDEINLNNLSSVAVSLQILPNTKYYYTFRGVDVHGLISNPTDVYELEIIDNDGAIYSVLNTINLSNKIDYSLIKNFRKYLSITPSFAYSQINLLENNQIKFGQDDKLWNQKFKIRVTSKKSGKSFDVNLSFTKKEQDLT